MTTKKVAVIGLGKIGKTISQNLIKGNRSIILASKKIEDAQALSLVLGDLATAKEIREAIDEADIIIMAIPFTTISDLLLNFAIELTGKIIIDPSNPLSVDENGKLQKSIAEHESAGHIHAQHLPKNTKLAKVWSSLSAGTLAKSAFQSTEQAVLFYATDELSINNDVEQLIKDNGYTPLRVGGLDQSIRIEFPGDLSELALGKTLNLTEAISKL